MPYIRDEYGYGLPYSECRITAQALRAGLEPATPRLTAECSTIELPKNKIGLSMYTLLLFRINA